MSNTPEQLSQMAFQQTERFVHDIAIAELGKIK